MQRAREGYSTKSRFARYFGWRFRRRRAEKKDYEVSAASSLPASSSGSAAAGMA